jgi:hypothetical protein
MVILIYIPIKNGFVVSKIHQTYRIGYLKVSIHCYLLSFYFLPYSYTIFLSSMFFRLTFTFNIPGYITTSF